MASKSALSGYQDGKTTLLRRVSAQPLVAQLLLDEYEKLAALYARCADDAIVAGKRGARADGLPIGRVVPSPSKRVVKQHLCDALAKIRLLGTARACRSFEA